MNDSEDFDENEEVKEEQASCDGDQTDEFSQDNLPATKFGWGGARVKGVHSVHTKTNQKKIQHAYYMSGKQSKMLGKSSKNLPCTHVVMEISE
jgi:hypothetical protein